MYLIVWHLIYYILDMAKRGRPPGAANRRDEDLLPTMVDPYIGRAVEASRSSMNTAIDEGDVERALDVTALEAVLTLRQLMREAKSEKTRSDAAKELAHMAGYKPIERRLNLNKNIGGMGERELDTMIISQFNRDSGLVGLLKEAIVDGELIEEREYIESIGDDRGGVGCPVDIIEDGGGGEAGISEVIGAAEVTPPDGPIEVIQAVVEAGDVSSELSEGEVICSGEQGGEVDEWHSGGSLVGYGEASVSGGTGTGEGVGSGGGFSKRGGEGNQSEDHGVDAAERIEGEAEEEPAGDISKV